MLSKVLPNWSIVGQNKRRLLAATFASTILYGAEAWGRAVRTGVGRRLLVSVQRRVALRVCRGYRTMSADAAQILASLIPIDLLIEERMRRWQNMDYTAEEVRKRTIDQWCERWETNENRTACWTRLLIEDLRSWYGRKHGEITFGVAQVLSGHGCFGHYLCRIGVATTARCKYVDSDDDTAEHTTLECVRWNEERRNLYQILDVAELTPMSMIPAMLRGAKEWDAISYFFERIMREKEREAKQNN